MLFVLNVILFIEYTYSDANRRGGWQSAEEIAEELSGTQREGFSLSEEGAAILEKAGAWAILIEDGTGDVMWHSDNLPSEIPLHYSASDISWCTRGYIEDYPTTAGARGNDLLMLGHPKQRYWKHMWNTWDYDLIKNAPRTLVKVLGVNLLAVILIYMISTFRILRSVKPIVDGIEALPEDKSVYVEEKGLLSGLAGAINRASEKLRIQEYTLKKKERAQADWIAGVSHDIRTPLSMVMGYAGQLEENQELPEETRNQAQVIRLQSVRMKNLVNDLNLYSKLEYNMQPLTLRPVNLAAVFRLAVADFINLDLEGKYPVEWKAEEGLPPCMIEGDKELLGRAVNNILTNVRAHNPDGCGIVVKPEREDGKLNFVIEDDGTGVEEEQLKRLCSTPHYMLNDGNGEEERHGMGLLIVRQIVEVHGGKVKFFRGSEGGFGVKMEFSNHSESTVCPDKSLD